MKKALFFLLFATLFLPLPSYSAEVVIACIMSSDIQVFNDALNGFKQSFSDAGMAPKIVVHNLKTKARDAVVADIKNEKPTLVMAIGNESLDFASSDLADSLPVVFCMVSNYKKTKPSVTGVSIDIAPDKKLKEIKRILPGVKSIGLLNSPESAPLAAAMTQACSNLNLSCTNKEVSSPDAFMGQLNSIVEQINCFIVIPDVKIYNVQTIKLLLLVSNKSKVPIVGLSNFYTKSGALLAIEADYTNMGKQAGKIAMRIIKGEAPQNIEVENPNKTKFSLNLNTAKQFGLTISDTIIKEASETY